MTSVTRQADTNIMPKSIVHLNEEKCYGDNGRGLELGLSPLAGFASLQLLQ